MLLNRTILQLDVGPIPQERARELAAMGYLQWLGGLPADASYPEAAHHALRVAGPFCETSPAVLLFSEIVEASLGCMTLDLTLPSRQRRGGARARRGAL